MGINQETLEAFGVGWIWDYLPPGSYSLTYATDDIPESAVHPLRYELVPIDKGLSFMAMIAFESAPKDSLYYQVPAFLKTSNISFA